MRTLIGNEARVVQRAMIQAERPLFDEAEFMGAAELGMKDMPAARSFRFHEVADELRELRLDWFLFHDFPPKLHGREYGPIKAVFRAFELHSHLPTLPSPPASHNRQNKLASEL